MRQFLTIALAAAAIGILNFLANPNRPVFGLAADEIDVKTAESLPAETIIVDARSPKEFAESHLEGALNLSEDNFEGQVPEFLDVWTPGMQIVVYCSSSACNSSRSIANRLRDDFGIKNVLVLKGDWRTWKK